LRPDSPEEEERRFQQNSTNVTFRLCKTEHFFRMDLDWRQAEAFSGCRLA
jgi:hypothetical protein